MSDMVVNPSMSSKILKNNLRAFAKPYALTANIIQTAKKIARRELFGIPSINMTYAVKLQAALVNNGHYCEIEFTPRNVIMKNVKMVVTEDEIRRRQGDVTDFSTALAHNNFFREWKKNNCEFIELEFGKEEEDVKFVTGILFAPSFNIASVLLLQKVIQADAAHMNIGKYTLYSMYSATTNCNMLPVVHAILFGNENKSNWQKVFKFARNLHPSLNASNVTILSDQDKGSIPALMVELPNAFNFHCSFHRSQNIQKNCGGGSKQTNTAKWFYDRLLGCTSVAALESVRITHEHALSAKDLRYLGLLNDTAQYPAAR
jgi:hypothetical protein